MEVEAQGKTFTFPEGTTNAQIGEAIDDYFVKNPVEPVINEAQPSIATNQLPEQLPKGNLRDAIEEPIFSIGSNILGQIGSGIAGAAVAPFKGVDESVKTIKNIQSAVNEFSQPKTQAGEDAMLTIGDLMETGIDLARVPLSGLAGIAELLTGQGLDQTVETIENVKEKGFKAAGERVLEETGSPLLATATEIAPELAASTIPVSKMIKARGVKNKELASRIEAGDADRDLAKFKIDAQGKAVKDTTIKRLTNQGFDQGALQAFKVSSDPDKLKLIKMLDIKRKGKQNQLFAVKNRPSDIAGNSLMERVTFVRNTNRAAGKQLNIEANKLKGQSVDFKQPIDNFMDSLDEMGISLDRNLKPIFSGSDIEGAKAAENAIKNIVGRLARGERGAVPSAYDLHRMKRFIDEIVTYGKAGEGLAGNAERIIKKLRRDIDATLDSNFPEYNKVNTIYADTINSLDGLQDVAGRKMNLSGGNADKAVGTLLRRMMSNAQSRINLVDAVDDLELIAKKYGGNFNDDIATQMLFADELDSVFGASARTSFKGEIEKGVQQGIDAATGGKSALGKAADITRKGINKVLGQDEQKTFDLIKEMLEQKIDPFDR